MDILFDLVAFVVSLACEVFGRAFLGCFQAAVGVLMPTPNPAIRRMKRVCVGIMGAGLACVVAATSLIPKGWGWAWLGMWACAAVLFIGAGVIGRQIERMVRTDAVSSG
jgi:hypothetical protein